MLNQVVLVGRLVKDPELKEVNNKKITNITIAVPRSYKNINGEYDTDFIDCTLWQGVAENTTEFCKKGDIIGIKGRMESDSYEKDQKMIYKIKVIAERVTFIGNKKEKETK